MRLDGKRSKDGTKVPCAPYATRINVPNHGGLLGIVNNVSVADHSFKNVRYLRRRTSKHSKCPLAD